MEHPLINKIESRLQFVITITTVFLVAFPGITPSGYVLVVAYIFAYIAFAFLNNKLTAITLHHINVITFIGIASFIVPFILLAMTTQNHLISNWQAYTWIGSGFVSVITMMVSPIILLILILWKGLLGLKKS